MIFALLLNNSDDTLGYEYTERVLCADVRLYAHGELSDRYGELAFGKPEVGSS